MRTEAGTWNDGWFDAMPALPSAPLQRAACLVLLAFAAAPQLAIPAADTPLPRAAARGPRTLHDLLGPADAGGVRGGLACDVREASPRMGRARSAGAGLGADLHLHAKRLGRHLRRHRAALPAAGLPPARVAAGRAGGVPRPG